MGLGDDPVVFLWICIGLDLGTVWWAVCLYTRPEASSLLLLWETLAQGCARLLGRG